MVKLAFTGDIAFSKYFKDSFEDPELIDARLIAYLNTFDYVIPNVEGAMTRGNTQRGDASIPAHASDPRAAKVLTRIKGNIWNLSNNHTLDCGGDGLRDTLDLAKTCEARTVGAGMNEAEAIKPMLLKEAGGIGILAVCYKKMFAAAPDRPGLIDWDNLTLIQKTIEQIKRENRWCILIAHGGEEFSDLPMPYVRKKYLRYIDMGADIVVGHHPHVPQGYEAVKDKMIFYSLGNFIFDTDYQRLQKHTTAGVLLGLSFDEKQFAWDAMPYEINRETQRVDFTERTPIAFQRITSSLYRRTAPLAVTCFLKNYKRAKIFLKPHFKDYTALQWAKWYIREKGFWNSVSLFLHRGLYVLGYWKKTDPALRRYLEE